MMYSATVESNANATINITNGQEFEEDSTISIIYKAKKGYKFSEAPTLTYKEFNPMLGYEETVTENFEKTSDTEYHYDYNVWADFTVSCVTEVDSTPVTEYTATVQDNVNATINITNGEKFAEDSTVKLVYNAKDGWKFSEPPTISYQEFSPSQGTTVTVTENFVKTSDTEYHYDYNVWSDFTVSCKTVELPKPVTEYTATVQDNANATINITDGQKFAEDSNVKLIYKTKDGWKFSEPPKLSYQEFNPMQGTTVTVTENFVKTSDTEYYYDYNVWADFTVSCKTVELPKPVVEYTATVPVNPNVTINLTNGQKIEDGTTVNIRCEVHTGNEFVSAPTLTYQEYNPVTSSFETVAVDFVKESETVYTLLHKVTEDFTVSYTTQEIIPPVKYQITNELSNCTSNIPEGTQYDENATVDITVIANEGFNFVIAPELQNFSPTSGVMEKQIFDKVSDTEYHTTATMKHDWNIVANAVEITPISEGYGVITVYNPSATELKELSKKRFFGVEGKEVDIGKYIIDLYKIFVPVKTGNPSSIHLGIHDTKVMAKVVTDDVLTFDCGTITITGKYQNKSDYGADVEIYLPFIGTQKLDTSRVMDRSVNLTYKVNTLNGDVVAIVSTVEGYKEHYSGKCRMTVPYILMEHNVNKALNIEADFMIQENPSITVTYRKNIPVANINDTNDTGRIGDKPTGFTRMDNIILADTTANITEQKFIIETLQNGIII